MIKLMKSEVLTAWDYVNYIQTYNLLVKCNNQVKHQYNFF